MREKKLHKHEKELIFNRFFFMFKYTFKELTSGRNLDGIKVDENKAKMLSRKEKKSSKCAHYNLKIYYNF